MKSVYCDIDGKIRCHFSHYLQDDKMEYQACTLRKGYRFTLLYKNILSLANEKYYGRLGRTNEEPTFLYCFNLAEMDGTYLETLDKLLEIKSKLAIVIHESIELGERRIPENVTIIKIPDDCMSWKATVVADAIIKTGPAFLQNR